MTRLAAKSMTPGETSGGPAPGGLRVLLVGQTGLDQTLRREPGIEILRARNSFEAVGELGTPIDAESPKDAVVIVAPGTVTAEELAALSQALRRVDPGVCIVGQLDSPASRAAAPEPARFGLDAWVTPPISAGVLRLLVTNRAGTVKEPSVPQRTPSVSEGPVKSPAPLESSSLPAPAVIAPAQSASPATPASDGRGLEHTADAAPLQAVLGGTDLVTACLSILRARPGMESCAFVASSSQTPTLVSETNADTQRTPVIHRGHVFGTLTGPRDRAEDLKRGAEWMALWLALREQQSQLRRAAFTDALTGAWNRRYFDGFIARAIGEARSSRSDLTVLLFDIDNFKHYNDRFGHAAGDEILIETVRLLKSVVRSNDRVCRVGGDEFAVIFHEPHGPREAGSQHPSCILDLAKRFQRQVAQTKFPKLADGAPGTLAISGGLATYPWDGHDAESLMAHADRLLRDSKSRGKNVVRIGPGAMKALGAHDSTSSA